MRYGTTCCKKAIHKACFDNSTILKCPLCDATHTDIQPMNFDGAGTIVTSTNNDGDVPS